MFVCSWVKFEVGGHGTHGLGSFRLISFRLLSFHLLRINLCHFAYLTYRTRSNLWNVLIIGTQDFNYLIRSNSWNE